MAKILYILSAVMLLISALFIWQNRTSFVETREQRKEVTQKTSAEMGKLRKLGEEVEVLNDTLKAPSDAKTEVQVASVKDEIKGTQTQVQEVTLELEGVQSKISDYKAQLSDIPEGVSLETLGEDINKIKTTIAENQKKFEETQALFAEKDVEIKKAEVQLREAQKRIEDRKKLFAANSFSSRVVDVNNEWGFVVIQGGRDRGVTPQMKMVVTRGNQTIGKVQILSVEGSRTIGNIIPNVVSGQQPVSPGDRVVLESLYQ